jgi:hypothetical protein
MNTKACHDPLPASLHDVAAVLIVRHLERHCPEVVVHCLFDSYQRLADQHLVTEERVRQAERLAQRRLSASGVTLPAQRPRPAASQAWRPSQSSIAL